jgi:cysteinyl-tRNA synthetase
MLSIFIITILIITLTLTGFIFEIHRLQNEIEKKDCRLALMGKNYSERLLYKQSVINSHCEEIRELREKNKRYAKRIKKIKESID